MVGVDDREPIEGDFVRADGPTQTSGQLGLADLPKMVPGLDDDCARVFCVPGGHWHEPVGPGRLGGGDRADQHEGGRYRETLAPPHPVFIRQPECRGKGVTVPGPDQETE